MPSPFPGMDPYLEAHWLDVHPSLCTYARDALNAQLGDGLVAQLGERVVVERIFDEPRGIYPDIRVIEHGGLADLPAPASDVAVAEPIVLAVDSEPIRQPFIEVRDLGTGKVITVIEFLSPTNKLPGEGKRQYRKKQKELFDAQVSLIEIDLIRPGEHVLLVPAAEIPSRTPYQICVFRGYRPEKVEYYPITLAQRLPAIRIPLRDTDTDVVLNIQSLIDQAYRNGRYAELLNYRRPCIPPLEGEEAAWAESLLKQAGRR